MNGNTALKDGKNMIIVKLQGGLGNQMFQYALGRNLSLTHAVPLKIDSSYLRRKNQSGRDFRLFGFTAAIQEATPKELRRYIGTAQKILDRARSAHNRRRIVEKTSAFQPDILERNDGYFDGHWQTPRYFEANEATVRNDWTLKNPFSKKSLLIESEIKSFNTAVGIHLRRDDYASIGKIAEAHGTLPLSYYENACATILAQKPDAHFFVFSDEIEWTIKHFPKKYPLTFVSSPDIPDYEEMTLMGLCGHNIIANSTFSWWSAWLNRNPGKIVIAPTHWFRDQKRTAVDLIMPSWTQI